MKQNLKGPHCIIITQHHAGLQHQLLNDSQPKFGGPYFKQFHHSLPVQVCLV